MNEPKVPTQTITPYASVLNAAHLIAEETDQRLHELAARYPDAFPPGIVTRDSAFASGDDNRLS